VREFEDECQIGLPGEDDKIYPIVLSEDHPNMTKPHYPIPLSQNPQQTEFPGQVGKNIPYYVRWNIQSIEEQIAQRGLNSDGSFKKAGNGLYSLVYFKPTHKAWATDEDFSGQNITPERRKIMETYRDQKEYEGNLKNEALQSVKDPDIAKTEAAEELEPTTTGGTDIKTETQVVPPEFSGKKGKEEETFESETKRIATEIENL
jgi:hypothetical protein